MNQVILVGKITDKPIVKQFGNENQLAVIYIEVTKGYSTNSKENNSSIFQVILWKSMIQKYIDYCEKDTMIAISGRLQANNFKTKEGNIFYNCEIIAEKISIIHDNIS